VAIDLGIYDPNSPQSKKSASIMANTQGDMLTRLINQSIATLDGSQHANFNSIIAKYPFLSKEVIVGLVKAGANADTPGIDKVTSLDGIQGAIRAATAVKDLPSTFNKDKSLFQTVGDAVYGTLKGTSRAGFALLRSPYDYITTVARDIYSVSQNEAGAGMRLAKNLNPGALLFGKTSNFGSLARDVVDGGGVSAGSGFFIDPKSRVGKEQARAMQSFGRVNGQSFTIGRASLSTVGADPNSTLYKTASGIIDAVLNVAADPTTYATLGIAPLLKGGKILATGGGKAAAKEAVMTPTWRGAAKEGRKRAEAQAIAQKEQEIRSVLSPTGEEDELLKARQNELGKITRAVDNTYMRADKDVAEAERALIEARNMGLTKYYENVEKATSKTLPEIDDVNVSKFLEDTVIAGTQDDVIRSLSTLSADFTNTRNAFPGAFVVEELPAKGQFVVGARDMDEYAIALEKADVNVLDLLTDYSKFTKEQVDLEQKLRARLFDDIENAVQDVRLDKPTRKALELVRGTEYIDNLLMGDRTANLAGLIGKVAATKNEYAVGLLTNMIEDIWKVDAFSNTRAIYGRAGGVAIVNSDIVAAKQADISKFLADSTRVGTVIDSVSPIQDAKKALAKAEKKRSAAARAKKDLDRKIKEVEVLRDYVSKDPDLIAHIVNNPQYGKLGTLMDLELEIGQKNFLKELYSAEAGLVDGIGGPLTQDLNKANEFLLGKRFAVVADIVAAETSAARILRLFNNKIDLEVAGALADAKSADEVLYVLRSHLASPTADPQLARSMTLRGQTLAASVPLVKSVMPVSQKALARMEQMEMFFTKQYARSKILPLADLDLLGKGVAEWMGTAGVSQEVIDSTLNKLVAAKATNDRSINAIRSKIIDDAFLEAQQSIINRVNPASTELKELLAKELKLAGEEKAVVTNYANTLLAQGVLPSVIIQDGIEVFMDGAVYAHQFMDDVVRLPDTKPIYRAVQKYEANKKLAGGRAAAETGLEEFGELWRTAQLAFRMSYIVRNVGEMQFRQYLSGHETLLSHPIGYIAMMISDPNSPGIKKLASHIAKYDNDIMGNSFKDPEGAKLLSEAVDEHLKLMSNRISAGDMRSVDAKTRMIGKIYSVIGSEHPEFHRAFATTLSRFNLDDMMQLVAKADNPVLENQLLDNLISNKPVIINNQERTNIIQEIYESSRIKRGNRKVGKTKGESGFDDIFLKDPDKGFSYDNLNEVGIRNWLFDPNSTASYRTALNGLMGNGQKGIYIQKLLADGVVSVPGKNGKPIIVRMPRYKDSASVEEGGKAEEAFKATLKLAFPSDEMKDATAIFADSKTWLSDNENILKRAVDGFFNLSARIENVAAYGPEYRMSYWDHVGRYAPALGLDDLLRLQKEANKTLAPVRALVGNKYIPVGKRHQTLSIINREIKRRQKMDIPTNMTYEDAHKAASKYAGNYVRDLFYDPSRQLDSANKVRLIFPFIQAHFNTIKQWGKLSAQNPRQVYKFGKAYDALTKPGTSAIYDLTDTEYEEGTGFFYKDEFGELRFRYPLVGGLFSAFAGMSMNAKDALQLTAPVQSLNLAFGSVNPGMPGVGPVAQIAYMSSGKSHAFGPAWDIARDWIFPFGEPKTWSDAVLPSWLNKTFLLSTNNSAQVERNVKDWAGYLASTGEFGDNPFASDASREELFTKAQSMSRWTSLMGAIFQSIAPATPSQEVMAAIKTDENKYNFIAMTQMYKNWDEISKANPGKYEEAIKQFVDRYGYGNVMVILSGSTKSVTGTDDAWGFLNNNPDIVKKYATRDADIVPYFFPGGEAAMSYYNWQVASNRRSKLTTEQLQTAAEDLVYNMELSRISEEQAMMGYGDIWYTDKVVELNKKYGGKPVSSVLVGRQEARAVKIGEALEDDAFKASPIYKETKEFYDRYDYAIKTLQDNRLTPQPDLGSSFWLNTKFREELQTLGNELMLQNPAFSRMYYSVFANLLKKQGE
jgi:hypothetical protein